MKEMTAIAALLAANPGFLSARVGLETPAPKKTDKPEFTPEELEHLRSLPKAERKRAVAALKEKYFASRKEVLDLGLATDLPRP